MKKKPLKIKITKNIVDKAFDYFAPVLASRRMRARLVMEFANSYDGASKVRRGLKSWNPRGGSADSDLLLDLDALRDRSRDLVRNNPIASGAIKTKVTNVIGSGIRLRPNIDQGALGMSDEDADAWEIETGREWRLFFESKDCDVSRTCNGLALIRQAYQQALENGDVVILLPKVHRAGLPYDLKLQVIEADRLCNANMEMDSETLSCGIEKDKFGAPVKYHISKYHPGDFYNTKAQSWDKVLAFGPKSGLRNVIHLYKQTRPGQSRGVPDLAAIIEPLKQLGKYTEAEIMAAVISGFLTVFVESESGDVDFDYSKLEGETGQKSADDDLKLGNGLIVGLGPGEKISSANPGRPNTAFDPFVMAILKQIGIGLEIPFEILIKHFSASYSAARGALNEFWKFVTAERRWLYDDLLILIYEVWMWEWTETTDETRCLVDGEPKGFWIYGHVSSPGDIIINEGS